MPELTVSVGVPAGAVVLPLTAPADEIPGWADRTARERLGPEAPEDEVAALASALGGAVADSRTRGPVTALSFCPDPARGELARIEVSVMRPPPEAAELSVRDLANYLAGPTPRSGAPADVAHGRLPIGPAVRVRHQYVTPRPADPQEWEDGDSGESGEQTVLQTVAYAARPAQTDHAVLLFVSWQALALGERLDALVDRLAETLRLVPVDPESGTAADAG